MAVDRIRCGIVGCGPVFNWGWMHGQWLKVVPEMELVAFCDRDPAALERTLPEFPGVDGHTDLAEMLRRDDIDMVSVVTPHNTHAALVIQCLRAGKHTVVEKPMCLTIPEADAMVEAACEAGRTLAVYHNRRHDGNVRAIHELVKQGTLGEVFHIEVCAMGYSQDPNYGRPGDPWRASKAISGGGLYDWGAHAVDWVLSMVPSPMTHVTGFFHRFHDADSSEDHTRAIIHFANGCAAEVCCSRASLIGKPYLWYVLGTKGAIIDSGANAIAGYCNEVNGPSGGSLTLRTPEGERTVPYKESDWATYYKEMADHLLRGAPVPVSGEDGRRVITVLQTAEKSSASGHSEAVPHP